ncbi:MAG: translesion error-prone DNA polymerase V subunit UmuC [Cyanobacteria bacterium P01_F01_bin.3]
MSIFALVDVNNFYASCERVFNPTLLNKPVVVLSNNDGCIIARSSEAKKLGIKMGEPWYKRKAFCEQNNVAVFSSNYALYGDMSQRVMQCLSTFTPNMEVYSVDEAFLQLDGFEHLDLIQYATRIKETVLQWTGLPVSVGLGSTKTLAKVANHIAKQLTKTGVFSLCGICIQAGALPTIPVEKVWGIGQRWSAKLNQMGIETAMDLRRSNPAIIKQEFNVVAERIVYELRGNSCLALETIQPKKNIMVSRSFGKLVTDESELLEAISCYAARSTEKLRQQESRAGGLYVFLRTNRFRENAPQYKASMAWTFPCATNDTREVISAARACLKSLYKDGFEYHKCGVMLLDIAPANAVQSNLFHTPDYRRSEQLMAVVDQLNTQMGRGTVSFAAQGIKRDWQMKQQMRSPRYTTQWNELMVARC